MVLFWVFVAIFAPFLTPYTPLEQDWKSPNVGPCMKHPLGTDELGRDLWSRTYLRRPGGAGDPAGVRNLLDSRRNRHLGRYRGAARRDRDPWPGERILRRLDRRGDHAPSGRHDGRADHPALPDHHGGPGGIGR